METGTASGAGTTSIAGFLLLLMLVSTTSGMNRLLGGGTFSFSWSATGSAFCPSSFLLLRKVDSTGIAAKRPIVVSVNNSIQLKSSVIISDCRCAPGRAARLKVTIGLVRLMRERSTTRNACDPR